MKYLADPESLTSLDAREDQLLEGSTALRPTYTSSTPQRFLPHGTCVFCRLPRGCRGPSCPQGWASRAVGGTQLTVPPFPASCRQALNPVTIFWPAPSPASCSESQGMLVTSPNTVLSSSCNKRPVSDRDASYIHQH